MVAKQRLWRPILAWTFPLSVAAASLVLAGGLRPFERLLLSTVALFLAFKAAALIKLAPEGMNLGGLAAYWAWPGIDPKPFQGQRHKEFTEDARFGYGLTRFSIGLIALGVTAWFSKSLSAEASTWLTIASLLFAFHLGFSDVATGLAQALGWKVLPLFDSPLRAKSLADFWSRRWNRPFVELDRIFFLPALSQRIGLRAAVFGVFLMSGLLHELAISYPAGAGWGMPLLYFALQGLLFLAERKFRLRGSAWTLLAVLVPLPLLFHAPFREACVLPLVSYLHGMLHSVDPKVGMNWLILFLSGAQLMVLLASFQVPTRLRWKEELPKLDGFNRKLMWTYGAFIVFTIVAWAILTFALREEILTGTRTGLAVSLTILLFWFSRLMVDAFYFKSEDWPRGPFMQIGHAMLNALFCFICGGYGILATWSLLAST